MSNDNNMKKLIFLLLIVFLSCTKKDDPPPPIVKHNVVFFSSGGPHKISGEMGTFTISKNYQSAYPNCDSYSDANTGYRVVYMKDGKYNITVTTNIGDVIIPITIHEANCNTFDVAYIYGWQ